MIIEINNDNRDIYVTYFEKGNLLDGDKINIDLGNNRNGCLFKPDKGFWGSPIDAKYGWKEWCEDEKFGNYDFDKPYYWTLSNGKILQIDWDEVRNAQTSNLSKYIVNNYLDWNKMLEDNIIAVQLMDSCIGHSFINVLESKFNAWDCESIVVLDKNKIVFV